ncbi:MAG: hypothetical protein O9327_15810, partial [Polaromonas sp.]|nr:hypothetical protein [Polaromonas sp.]
EAFTASTIPAWRTAATPWPVNTARQLVMSMSRKTAYGVRSVREQGLDIDITNWRAVFTGQGVAAVRQAGMVEAVKASLGYELWKKTLKQAWWEQSWLSGQDLASFIDFETKTTQLMVQLLKLKA